MSWAFLNEDKRKFCDVAGLNRFDPTTLSIFIASQQKGPAIETRRRCILAPRELSFDHRVSTIGVTMKIDSELHPGQAHSHTIRIAICIDENQVNQGPDAEATPGEELKNADNRMSCIKAMKAKVA